MIIQLPEDSLYTLEEGLFSLDFDYPFTWIHGQGWRFVVGRTDPSGGYYLYRFGPVPGWIWTAPHLHGWHYDFSAQSWQTP